MADLTLVHAGTYVSRVATPTSDGRNVTGPRYSMPMGCLYLMATAQRAGHTVEFRDYQFSGYAEPHDPDNLARFLEGSSAILGVSCMVDFLPATVLALERFKRRHPDTLVVLGGPGPSDCPEELMRAFPWLDVVVVGEGERTLCELLPRLQDGGQGLEEVSGIVFRDDGRVRSTSPRPRLRDLDELPFPHPAGVDLTRYRQANVVTSRGCPYECVFCDVAQLWDRTTTYRSTGNVIQEMRALAEMGFQEVCFQDDNFTLNRRRVSEFCTRTAGRDDLPRWACLGRADMISPDLLRQMKAGGCRGIFFGIESGSDRVLEGIMKGITARTACRAVEMAIDCFHEVETYFIWGFPEESAPDLMKTILLMTYFHSMGALTPIGLLSPLPKSILYRRHKHRLLLDERLAPFSLFSVVRKYQNDPRVGDLIRKHPHIFPSFYTYETLDRAAKVELMERFVPINGLEMARPLPTARA